jgi:phage FluMu protein Com
MKKTITEIHCDTCNKLLNKSEGDNIIINNKKFDLCKKCINNFIQLADFLKLQADIDIDYTLIQ